MIGTEQAATQVRDYLSEAMDKDDGLLVTLLAGEAVWMGLTAEVGTWLKQQLERKAA